MSRAQLEKMITATEKKMKEVAKDLDFIQAAQYRDELLEFKKKIEGYIRYADSIKLLM